MYVIGDPVDISVESVVPEPASLGLIATAAVLLCQRHRRRSTI
jgi:hypothetical protein